MWRICYSEDKACLESTSGTVNAWDDAESSMEGLIWIDTGQGKSSFFKLAADYIYDGN